MRCRSQFLSREGTYRLDLRREDEVSLAWLHVMPTDAFETFEAQAEDFLGASELTHFGKLKFERRQCSYLLGRYAAKQAASKYLNRGELREIEIGRGVFDQPVPMSSAPNTPAISISHTQSWVVALAHPCGHPMGVDLEEFDPERLEVIRSQMTSQEIEWSRSELRLETLLLTLMWTAKEALSKVLRCGLTTPMKVLEISKLEKLEDRQFRGTFRNFAQYKFLTWSDDHRVLSLVLPRKTDLVLQNGK